MERKGFWILALLYSIISCSNALLPSQRPRQLENPTSLAAFPTKETNEGQTRREIIHYGALALSSLLVPGTSPAPATEPKTIVLTGT